MKLGKSDYEIGYETGKDRGNSNGIHDATESFANQTNPFTSREFKDGFEDGLDSHQK